MHCLLKWLETESSKQACPMDRRPWGKYRRELEMIADRLVTADRKPDTLPTTTTGEPVEVVPPGAPPPLIGSEEGNGSVYEEEEGDGTEEEEEGEVGNDDGEDGEDNRAEENAETDMVY